jgi:hypothetical protein
MDVTLALTSDNTLATHSGTGEGSGSGNELDILSMTRGVGGRITAETEVKLSWKT